MTREEYMKSRKLSFEGLACPETEADPDFIEHVDAMKKALDEFEYLYLEDHGEIIIS